MPKAIIFTDTHNTDNPAHEYRWECWDDIARWAQSPKIDMIIHLGDILDAKDHHSASLINRMLDKIHAILDSGKPFLILRGNHDYKDVTTPYFHFLRHLANVIYVDNPQVVDVAGGYRILAVPHGASWDDYAPWRRELPLAGGYDLILAHHTFCGATLDGQGVVLNEGPSPSVVDEELTAGAPVLSGHVHQEQQLGNVMYVGSPHPVSFGETTSRFVTFDFETRTRKSVRRASIKRAVIHHVLRDDGSVLEDPKMNELSSGDHVQITTTTTQAGLLHYADFRNAIQKRCDELGIVVFKLQAQVSDMYSHVEVEFQQSAPKTDAEIFAAFCDVNEITQELRDIGAAHVGI